MTFMTPDPRFDKIEHMQGKVDDSINLSWDAIKSCATDTPVDFVKENGSFIRVLKKLHNAVARLFSEKAMWASESLVNMVESMAPISRDAAIKMVQSAEYLDG